MTRKKITGEMENPSRSSVARVRYSARSGEPWPGYARTSMWPSGVRAISVGHGVRRMSTGEPFRGISKAMLTAGAGAADADADADAGVIGGGCAASGVAVPHAVSAKA